MNRKLSRSSNRFWVSFPEAEPVRQYPRQRGKSRAGAGIPSTAHVAMLTELEKFEVKEFPMPQVGDDDILVKVEGQVVSAERMRTNLSATRSA